MTKFKLYFQRFLTFTVMIAVGALCADAIYPVVRNFTRQQYGAGAQNWAIAQAPDGNMLFGNQYGVLLFDSNAWSTFKVSNQTTVRSMLVDVEDEKLYVGESSDFGYFSRKGANGPITYTSLRSTIVQPNVDFKEIWNIIKTPGRVWFQGDFSMFCYDGKKTTVIPLNKKITASTVVNNIIYVAFDDGQLSWINTADMLLNKGVKLPVNARICSVLPFQGNSLLLATPFDGLFLFNNGTITPYPIDIDGFLKENQVFCATISDKRIVFGTVNRGIVIRNIATGENTYVNVASGLQNNTVLTCAFDNLDNLWLGLDNGIDYVMTSAPITSLLGVDNTHGAGYASIRIDDRLYLGTNQGLFSTDYPMKSRPELPEISTELKGQVWSIDTIGQSIFVCGDLGLYVRRGGVFARIGDLPGTVGITHLKQTPDYAIAATYSGYYLLHNDGGVWNPVGPIDGFNETLDAPIEDYDGSLWISHWLKGVYRMRLDIDKRRFTNVKLYNTANGFPADDNNIAQRVGDKVLFSTRVGIYRYDDKTDTIKPHDGIIDLFKTIPTSRIFTSPADDMWIVSGKNVIVLSQNMMGELRADSTTYRQIGDKFIPGRENLNFIDSRRLIVGNEDGFYQIALNNDLGTDLVSNPIHIAAVYANQDSLVFADVFFQFHEFDVKLPYDMNSLRFEYIVPEYRRENAVSYSVWLENYDDNWSQYSDLTTKEYTNLPEGTYIFHAKAINNFTGQESETSFKFTIRPPWYRSVAAFICYLLLTIAIVYLVVRYFINYSQRQAKDMERRKNDELQTLERATHEEALKKDYEIAQLKSQQLEHDVKSKSKELSNTTMNLVRKNEILLDISDKLTKLSESLPSESEAPNLHKQIKRIKNQIRENISHDDDWRGFTRNFDIVYENYMQRLTEKYPNLTGSDQRLCAYLKMGLSSKEIAPLLNISFRSVEMSRYRLRKKMGLGPDVNLAEYLRNF